LHLRSLRQRNKRTGANSNCWQFMSRFA